MVSSSISGRVLVLGAVFAMMLVFVSYSADAFQCTVRDNTCNAGEAKILGMSGTTNAHAEISSQNNYAKVVCCSDTGNTLGTACSGRYDVVLNLSADTNAHVADPTFSTSITYPSSICLSGSAGLPFCTGSDNSCPSGAPVCIASISAETNAQIGDCSAYTRKICCRTQLNATVTDIELLNPVWGGIIRGDAVLNATASDPDGDPIQDARYNITYGGSSQPLIFHSDFSSRGEWEIVWDSRAITGIDNNVRIEASAQSSGTWGPWYVEYFTVNNTPPTAAITSHPNPSVEFWSGRLFDVSWSANAYASSFDLQYAEEASYKAGGDWRKKNGLTALTEQIDLTSLGSSGGSPTYCFRILPHDEGDIIAGSWTCEPGPNDNSADFSGCNCTRIDAEAPTVTEINSTPQYTRNDFFDVSWAGADDRANNVLCYQVQYKIINNRSSSYDEIQGWTEWSAINDMLNVQALEGSTPLAISCTSSDTATFDQQAVESSSADNRTYYFRARAIDKVDRGYSNMGSWRDAVNGTWIDKTVPEDIRVTAWDTREDVEITSPDYIVLTTTIVNFTVVADPNNRDYSGIADAGIEWQRRRIGSGYTIGGVERNSCGSSSCTIQLSWNGDYNISYRAYAVDRAGNINHTAWKSFRVQKPFGIYTDTNNLYMTLGSSALVPITVTNSQGIEENAKIKLLDYPYAKFVDISEGTLSDNNKTLDITLRPKESKTYHIIVYTADTCDDCVLTVMGNSTRSGFEEKISDTALIDIKVVFPPEFSGMAWLVFVLAGLIASVVHSKRDN